MPPPPYPNDAAATMTSLTSTTHDGAWPHEEAACEMLIAQLTSFVEGIPVDSPRPYIAPEFFTDQLEVAIEKAATAIREHPTSFAPAGTYINH